MPANIRPLATPPDPAPAVALGPHGPFPDVALSRQLERRWLHYAFLSRDHRHCMVANSSMLGPAPDGDRGDTRHMTILLVHERGAGWHSSQFNAWTSMPLWSAFRQPHAWHRDGDLNLAATTGSPAVELKLQRTSTPCTSQCAPLGPDQHFRWQSEAGVLARGRWSVGDARHDEVDAVGYHERVRGHWSWPALGGWVFGFANETQGDPERAPGTALVFTLIQPRDAALTTGSVMLWRHGRLRRHFPRRSVSAAVCGELDRDRVCMVPPLAGLFGVAPMQPVPRRLVIAGSLGDASVVFEFEAESAARIIIPGEIGLLPFSVHEVYGPCRVAGNLGRDRFEFESYGIVEFAGGASED